jgi:hypothetical protein
MVSVSPWPVADAMAEKFAFCWLPSFGSRMRSTLYAASAAVSRLPSLNLTSSRRVKTQVVGDVWRQRVASHGIGLLVFGSRCSNWSKMLR